MTEHIGFVGLGSMGATMVQWLLSKGYRVSIYDPDAQQTELLIHAGAVALASPAQVAQQADITLLMAQTTAQIEALIFGQTGLTANAKSGDLFIVMSTIDMPTLQAIHKKLAARGISLIDAPVTGMRRIERAALKCFVGGDSVAVERALPLLNIIAAEVTHFGSIGLGTAMKVINSLLTQVNRVVIAEGLALGAKAGLDPAQMVDTLLKTNANSQTLQSNAPRMLAHNFDGIPMAITVRDLELQVALGVALNMPTFMASSALQVHYRALDMGLAEYDAAAVVNVYEHPPNP